MNSGTLDRNNRDSNKTLRILVVDDNADLLDNVCECLELKGYEAIGVGTGPAALEALEQDRFDAMVLDVGIPGLDGFAVCKRARAMGKSLPIIMLTARDTVQDCVVGLESGADDYMVKPFSLMELTARLDAMIRRSQGKVTQDTSVLQIGDLVLDNGRMLATRAGVPLKLTRIGFQILRELMRLSPNVVTRDHLISVLWPDEPPMTDSLRTNLYFVRQAVDKPFDEPMIETVQGFGWVLVDPKVGRTGEQLSSDAS